MDETLLRRAQQLRASLHRNQRTHDLKGIPKHLHPGIKTRLDFSSHELAAWLHQKQIAPLVWRCPYVGDILALAEITIDHIAPLSKGGPTQLSNFAVTKGRTNRIKGNMSRDDYAMLRCVVDRFEPDVAQSIWNRMAQPPHAKMNEFRARKR